MRAIVSRNAAIPRPVGGNPVCVSAGSLDTPAVRRYDHALKTLGFDPWIDERAMPAGANLEREVLGGFEESCAAVFFITASFKDEKYLAAEVDYAVMQKRKKEKEVRDRDTQVYECRGGSWPTETVHLQGCVQRFGRLRRTAEGLCNDAWRQMGMTRH